MVYLVHLSLYNVFCLFMCRVFVAHWQAWAGYYFPRSSARGHLDPDPARQVDPRFAVRYLEYNTPPATPQRVRMFWREMDMMTVDDMLYYSR